ncbi:hypothetical protein DL96DRAFT_1623144 [Flagelloscypha sp. PMI_526]|nr:hypothetical protein DL96DRAFT_1623144 [Flagelloscypha sp. PMI_526]
MRALQEHHLGAVLVRLTFLFSFNYCWRFASTIRLNNYPGTRPSRHRVSIYGEARIGGPCGIFRATRERFAIEFLRICTTVPLANLHDADHSLRR